MTLAAGRQLLQYRMDSPIGQGGMGVVWKATDSTLGRAVALKFLPDMFAGDAERMARLEREARLLAALNHPNVASIFGLHQAEGLLFLAMEFVDGEDLSQRLARGPIPPAEALPIALHIAEALEHAHEKGVIHRDLKPANVKLGAGGEVKVLDFGLAKAIEGDPASARSGSALSQSPTITGGMTAANVLLGTAAYMSPEQARGQVADRRADIWAFGVLLWEMLTGRRMFDGDTISDTLAAVLRAEPDWTALPRETPARVRALLRRCLERDPRRRLRDIGEARIVLDDVLKGAPDDAAPVAAAPARGIAWLPMAGALALGVAATFAAVRLGAPPRMDAPVRKFLVEADTSGLAPRATVISPDGRHVASLVGGRLAIRDLARFESHDYAIEPGAVKVFWSPDSRNLALLSGSKVVKVSAGDGQTQVLCDTRAEFTGGSGGCWTSRGTIIFSRGDSAGILEISERGGDAHAVLAADTKLESDLHEPYALPNGRGILFAPHRLTHGIDGIDLWANGKRRRLVEFEGQRIYDPCYSPSGHILFRRAPNTPGIWAVPFSLAKLETTGEPFLVAADGSGPSAATEGTLCYLPGGASTNSELIEIERGGGVPKPIGRIQSNAGVLVASDPGGTRIVRSETEAGNQDLWIYDLVRGTRTRLTFDPGIDDGPAWSPDGREIAYFVRSLTCATVDCWKVVRRAADGTGRVDTLANGVTPEYTPDGKSILYVALANGGANWSLMRIAREPGAASEKLVDGKPYVVGGRVSPDGSYLAYASNESEHFEVYLTRYPSCEGRWQVSNQGGQWPKWSPKGDRLYFSRGGEIFEVDVKLGPSPTLGTPRLAFTRPDMGLQVFGLDMTFAVGGDGKHLVTARNAGSTSGAPGVAVVQNWFSEFSERK